MKKMNYFFNSHKYKYDVTKLTGIMYSDVSIDNHLKAFAAEIPDEKKSTFIFMAKAPGNIAPTFSP